MMVTFRFWSCFKIQTEVVMKDWIWMMKDTYFHLKFISIEAFIILYYIYFLHIYMFAIITILKRITLQVGHSVSLMTVRGGQLFGYITDVQVGIIN